MVDRIMYEQYLEDRKTVPKEQILEVRFEEDANSHDVSGGDNRRAREMGQADLCTLQVAQVGTSQRTYDSVHHQTRDRKEQTIQKE